MESEIFYYSIAVLLVVLSAGCWVATLFTLPGNWMIAVFAGIFTLIFPVTEDRGISWITIGVLFGLAAVGELIELAAGAAGAAKQGASRRAMLLAIVGTVVGSLVGAFVGIPIPVAGPIIGAVGGGGLGAFLGAYLGEMWKGKTSDERLAVSKAALIGRLLGTVGKLVVGAVMFVIVGYDAFL